MSARDFVPPAYSLRATRCRSVGCQGDGTDHQCRHALRGAGWSDANRRPNPKAAFTRSSTVMRRTRTISACRDAA